MVKMSGHMKMLIFAGAVEVTFGLLFVLMGVDSVILFEHGAIGAPMWGGILIIMVGLGNVLIAMSEKPKRSGMGQSINFGSMLVNLIGLIVACLLIAFYVWGAYDQVLQVGASQTQVAPPLAHTYGDLISLFVTVVLMGVIVLLLSLAALMADCCGFLLYGMTGPAFDTPLNHGHSEMYDGVYGLPPAALYKR